MKKSRFLILVLVVSISLIGAGYAYWTDALNINSTVNTGEFDVEFVSWDKDIREHGLQGSDNYTELDVQIDQSNTNKAIITVENLYPGKEVIYRLRVQNMGTIPAVFENAKVTFSGSEKLKEVLDGKFGDDGLGSYGFSSIEKLEEVINKNLKGLRLEKNESKVLEGTFRLPTDVVNSDKVELQKMYTNIELNWTQHNDTDLSEVVVPTSNEQ